SQGLLLPHSAARSLHFLRLCVTKNDGLPFFPDSLETVAVSYSYSPRALCSPVDNRGEERLPGREARNACMVVRGSGELSSSWGRAMNTHSLPPRFFTKVMLLLSVGHEVFAATGSRYAVDFRPSFTVLDIGINSALTLLQLRDVELA